MAAIKLDKKCIYNANSEFMMMPSFEEKCQMAKWPNVRSEFMEFMISVPLKTTQHNQEGWIYCNYWRENIVTWHSALLHSN